MTEQTTHKFITRPGQNPMRPELLEILKTRSTAEVSTRDVRLVDLMIGKKMNRLGIVLDDLSITASLLKLKDSPQSVVDKLGQMYDVELFSHQHRGEEDEHEKHKMDLTAQLIKSQLSYSFDPGLGRKIVFYPTSEYDSPIREEGAFLLRRSTFISEVNKKRARLEGLSNELSSPNFSFIDISNVRKADKATKVGHKAADLLVNRAAKLIENATQHFCEKKGIDPTRHPTIGRYGGDEFVVGWIPPLDDGDRAEFEMILKKFLAPDISSPDNITTAYYGVDDKLDPSQVVYEKGAIGLKNNHIDWIKTPHDPHEQIIFNDYFNRGLILTETELQIVKGKPEFQTGGAFSLEKYREYQQDKKKTTSLDSLTKVEEKVDYLARRHTNFAIPLYLAQYWDEVESAETHTKITKRQEAMVMYTKDILYDKLLGYGVISKFDYQEQVESGHVDYTIAIDLKFIKEMNELVGYAEADESITTLWKTINNILGGEGRENCTFGRAGGTFLIGINKGHSLSENTIIKLKNLTRFDLNLSPSGRGDVIQVPLGNSLTTTDYGQIFKTNSEGGKVVIEKNNMGEAMNDCEESFFYNVLSDLKKDEGLLDTIKISADPIKSGHHIGYGELLWRFFRLKRYDERMIKLIQRLTAEQEIRMQQNDMSVDPLRKTVIDLYGFMLSLDPEENAIGTTMELGLPVGSHTDSKP